MMPPLPGNRTQTPLARPPFGATSAGRGPQELTDCGSGRFGWLSCFLPGASPSVGIGPRARGTGSPIRGRRLGAGLSSTVRPGFSLTSTTDRRPKVMDGSRAVHPGPCLPDANCWPISHPSEGGAPVVHDAASESLGPILGHAGSRPPPPPRTPPRGTLLPRSSVDPTFPAAAPRSGSLTPELVEGGFTNSTWSSWSDPEGRSARASKERPTSMSRMKPGDQSNRSSSRSSHLTRVTDDDPVQRR